MHYQFFLEICAHCVAGFGKLEHTPFLRAQEGLKVMTVSYKERSLPPSFFTLLGLSTRFLGGFPLGLVLVGVINLLKFVDLDIFLDLCYKSVSDSLKHVTR